MSTLVLDDKLDCFSFPENNYCCANKTSFFVKNFHLGVMAHSWPLTFISTCKNNLHVLSAEPQVTEDPCVPSPCGRYSDCTNNQEVARCACSQGYFGSPPNCRPECLLSSDCSPQLACIQQKCSDPCVGVCGSNAVCRVVNHIPTCTCPPEFTGDPFVSCNKPAGRT